MDLAELEDSLQIVFDKELRDLTTDRFSYFFKGSQAKEITYPNGDTLIDIFSLLGQDTALKSIYNKTLLNAVKNANERAVGDLSLCSWIGTSALAFYVLIKLGCANEAIQAYKERKISSNMIVNLLVSIIDENYFNSVQLKNILEILDDGKLGAVNASELRSKITEARFNLLKIKIKNVNIEINQDKKTVSEKIRYLGLNNNYNQLLHDIDEFLLTDTSKVVNAGMISALRTFMGDLLKDIAYRIANGKEIPKIKDRGEMGSIRAFLKEKLELSNQDDKFVDAFVDILHTEGGHAFLSEKEYFRLSRNIAIEIALFVLSKYEKKYKVK